MARKRLKSAKIRDWILSWLFALILLVPIAIYIGNFGLTISSNHQRWSEMGSAMSGIYTPILTLFTLLVLLMQVRLQESMNRHVFDQAYLQNARADVNHYLEYLAKEMSNTLNDGQKIGPILIQAFSHISESHLLNTQEASIAKEMNKQYPSLVGSWSAFNTVLAGLNSSGESSYVNVHLSAKQKAIAMLSYAGCVALDNYTFAASDGRLEYHEFASMQRE